MYREQLHTKIRPFLLRIHPYLERARLRIEPYKVRVLAYVRRHRKKVILSGIAIVLGFLILVPIITYFYFVKDLGSKDGVIHHNDEGITLLDRNGTPFFTFYEAKQRHYVPLADIAKTAQNAVIASEDREFYSHPGFSIRGILRAVYDSAVHGHLTQGGSTLTQQVVKNVLLTPDRTFMRKYQEIFLAAELNRRFSKQDVLEMYLNSAYFGENAFGIEEAAQVYFNKSAKDLTNAEAAMLIGVLPAPSAWSPVSGNQPKAYDRQKVVLGLMQAQGYITQAEKLKAEDEELKFSEKTANINVIAPHFALMVRDELNKKYGEAIVTHSGFKVKTTINLDWQKFAEQTVSKQLSVLARNHASNGAMVALNPKNGEVLALVGSKDWSNEEFGKLNIVTRSRQPGSSFKPIIYAKALADRKITTETKLKDEVKDFGGGYKPQNYDHKTRGEVTVRRALSNSLNIPAVEVMEMVGVKNGIAQARKMGITSLRDDTDYGLSLVLGAAEVPLLQMTNVYASFANLGVQNPVKTILEIQDKKGTVIYSEEPGNQRVLDAGAAYLITSILSDNGARAEVFGNALTISRPAAVKTGTTESYRDALTIGYTPSLAIGVWVGNNDNSPMDNVAGSLGAAPIWRQTMEKFLAGTPVEQFRRPLDVAEVRICKELGKLLDESIKDSTFSGVLEYYIRGTQPTETCIAPTPTPTITPIPTETPIPTDTPVPTLTPTITLTPIPSPTSPPTPTSVVPSVGLSPTILGPTPTP